MAFTATLSYPPSANRYWRVYRGRPVKSAEARTYQHNAGWEARVAGMVPLDGKVSVTLHFFRPRRSGDIDNRIKVTLDALNGIAYLDDKQIYELHAYLDDDKHNPRVEVSVSPME